MPYDSWPFPRIGERPLDIAVGLSCVSFAGTVNSKKMEVGCLIGYQVGVEGVEEVPSDGALGGASGAGVEAGGARAGGGAGFRLTTRFLAAFRAFFFIAFLAIFFFFAKTRFTETMFRL
jgi:hypothetical protein